MELPENERRCPRCKQPLESGRAQGLCPRCLLLRAAFTTEADVPSYAASLPDPEAVAPAFPQLEILELIGRGGMGVVYRARQRSLNRLVALKLLAPERVADPAFAERFRREAHALAQLSHPNIVTIHDFGVAQGPSGSGTAPFYFLLMEFVDGVNIRQAMQAGRFTPEQALAIVPPVCLALQYAHERGIVHRDIKPENLLLDRNGQVKIADFGIARMLGGELPDPGTPNANVTPPATGSPVSEGSATLFTAAGTPQYMAPEQREPGRADHRADIYSLGVVLYELLTGELPAARLEPPSSKVEIDVRLDGIVLRALAVQPELRYATAAEFRTQVAAVGSGIGVRPTDPAATPALIRTSAGFLYRPEELSTVEGQFCAWRRRGQLVLDDERLTYLRADATLVIPLAAIRGVGVGELPRSMNPAGIDLLQVTYQDEGTERCVVILPAPGWFAWPGTWNDGVAEWAGLIRKAVAARTGRKPSEPPPLELANKARWSWAVFLLPLILAMPGMAIFLTLVLQRNPPKADNTALFVVMLLAIPLGTYAGTVGFFRLFRRRRSSGRPVGPWVLLGVLAAIAITLGGIWLGSRPRFTAPGLADPRGQPSVSLRVEPVKVDGNVLVVNLGTHVERHPAVLRVGLAGPQLSPEVLAELDRRKALLPAARTHSGTPAGNRAWQLQERGSNWWQVGFVFPSEAAAAETFRGLSAREFVGLGGDTQEIFDTIGSDGHRYVGSVSFSRSLPDWDNSRVAVHATWSETPKQFAMDWTLSVGGPCRMDALYDGLRESLALVDSRSLVSGRFQVILHELPGGRTHFSAHFLGQSVAEDVDGEFAETVAAFRAGACGPAEGLAGEEFELFHWRDHSLKVRVTDTRQPLPPTRVPPPEVPRP